MKMLTTSPISRPATPWRSMPWWQTIRVVLGVVAWALLMVSRLLTAVVVGCILLGIVLLGSGPSADADTPTAVVALALLAITGALAWPVARFFASARSVALTIGATLIVLLIAGATWALSSPDQALFLARDVAWGPSDVWDYQKFPQRVVNNAPPAFQFQQNLRPELFQNMTIEYKQDGQVKQADFEEFMKSSQTTSFLVIKDDAILYEGYFNGYNRDSIVTSFSMAKSVTSALIGIANDFAKFGLLFLNNGNWNGKQVISEQWVKESTSPYPNPNGNIAWRANTWFTKWPESNGDYKYQWWGKIKPDGSYDFMAIGHLGQRIYVSPQKRMVVVRHGISDKRVDAWEDVMASVIGKAK